MKNNGPWNFPQSGEYKRDDSLGKNLTIFLHENCKKKTEISLAVVRDNEKEKNIIRECSDRSLGYSRRQ